MSASKKITELWWVSVGGNACEPARVVKWKSVGEDGVWQQTEVYTIGCPDGTPIVPGCGIELVEKIDAIPLTPAQAEKNQKAWDRKVERDLKRGIRHGYRDWSRP